MVHTLRYQESVVNIVFCGRVRESCDGGVQIFRPNIHWWTHREGRQVATLELPDIPLQRMAGVRDLQKLEVGPVL
jgi:hypothetical protein